MPDTDPFASLPAEWNEQLDRAWRVLSPMVEESESFDDMRLQLNAMRPADLVDLAALVIAQAYIARVREEVRGGALTPEEAETKITGWLHGSPSSTARRRFRRD